MSTLMLWIRLRDDKCLADVRMDSGRDQDMEPNLSAFTGVLGKIFEPWVTTYAVVNLREELGTLSSDGP